MRKEPTSEFGKYTNAVEAGSWILSLAGATYTFKYMPNVGEDVSLTEMATPFVALGSLACISIAGGLMGQRIANKK